MNENRLVNTAEAAAATGLTEFQLRLGWKSGQYPAIKLGDNGRGVRLRWNLQLLEQAINEQMISEQAARKERIAEGV